MKFWEIEIFTTGLLCVLSADSSIMWCAILAIFCMFGIIMQQLANSYEEDKRRARAQKSIGSNQPESDAWLGTCWEVQDPASEDTTIWEEYQ